MDLFKVNFYWIDFAIGSAIPILVFFLYQKQYISKYMWALYWVGVLLGLTWEFPFSLLNEYSQNYPVARFIQPLPTHFMVIVVTHSFWDGGLFLLGMAFVYKFCKAPQFTKISLKELVVLLIWGQVSELTVEILSTFSNAWEFVPYWWNPTLFTFNGHAITLMPQLIWVAAPIAFYFIAVKLSNRLQVV